LIVVVTPDEERQEFLVRYDTVVLHVSPEMPLARSMRHGEGTGSALVFEERDHGDNPRPLGVDAHGLKASLAASFGSRGALFELEKQHGAWVITGLLREWVY
jgi:hypothetical protein